MSVNFFCERKKNSWSTSDLQKYLHAAHKAFRQVKQKLFENLNIK